jgi:Cysteine-rich CPCC
MGAMPERVACPCCGYRTLREGPGAYEVCAVCFWEDDGAAPWEVGGPNGISLIAAQERFLSTGYVHREERTKTRAPRPDEARDPDWQPLEVDPYTTLAEYNAVVAELRRLAPTLDYPEVKKRYQALSMKQGLLCPEPELELIAHLLKDEHWRLRHPGQALGWLWRHRRSASWRVRLRQLATGRVRLAG